MAEHNDKTKYDLLADCLQRLTYTFAGSFLAYFAIGSLLSLFGLIEGQWWIVGAVFTAYPLTLGSFGRIAEVLSMLHQQNAGDFVIAKTLTWFALGWNIYIIIPLTLYKLLKKSTLTSSLPTLN